MATCQVSDWLYIGKLLIGRCKIIINDCRTNRDKQWNKYSYMMLKIWPFFHSSAPHYTLSKQSKWTKPHMPLTAHKPIHILYPLTGKDEPDFLGYPLLWQIGTFIESTRNYTKLRKKNKVMKGKPNKTPYIYNVTVPWSRKMLSLIPLKNQEWIIIYKAKCENYSFIIHFMDVQSYHRCIKSR